MTQNNPSKLITKTVSVQGATMTLYSLDGYTWSSDPEEPNRILNRLEEGRLQLQERVQRGSKASAPPKQASHTPKNAASAPSAKSSRFHDDVKGMDDERSEEEEDLSDLDLDIDDVDEDEEIATVPIAHKLRLNASPLAAASSASKTVKGAIKQKAAPSKKKIKIQKPTKNAPAVQTDQTARAARAPGRKKVLEASSPVKQKKVQKKVVAKGSAKKGKKGR
jgi:hypothetical protein